MTEGSGRLREVVTKDESGDKGRVMTKGNGD